MEDLETNDSPYKYELVDLRMGGERREDMFPKKLVWNVGNSFIHNPGRSDVVHELCS